MYIVIFVYICLFFIQEKTNNILYRALHATIKEKERLFVVRMATMTLTQGMNQYFYCCAIFIFYF